jgi:hypothetical protein
MTVLLWGRAAEPVIDATARACARLGAHVAAADGEELASVELGGDLVTRDGRRVTWRTSPACWSARKDTPPPPRRSADTRH